MRIYVFDYVSDYYGSSRICRILIGSMRKLGFGVTTLVGVERLREDQRYGSLTRMPLLVGRNFRLSPIRGIVSLFAEFLTFQKQAGKISEEVDLVYCNTLGTVLVGLSFRLRGHCTLLHLHETSPSRVFSYFVRQLIRLSATHVICVSNSVAASWGLQRSTRVTVIHNGIDRILRDSASIQTNRQFDVSFVGRLSTKKGIFVFLEALRAISMRKTERGTIKVAIAGGFVDGDDVTRAKFDIPKLNGVDVTYFGEVDSTDRIFMESRVICVPSLFADPFPTVVLEGLRAGCAIVATEIGGAAEALSGAIGQLVKPGDAEALAIAIVRQIEDWTPATANANLEVFERRFSLEVFEDRFRDVFQKLRS